VAVDAAHIYWADGCGGLAQCCIGRANLDGTGVDRSFIDAGAGSAVAVDAGHIYWTTIFAIGRANLDGSGADPGFITLRDFPAGVAVDSGRIYWTLSSNLTSHFDPVIGRANLDGTGVDQSFITDTGPTVAGVAVDAAHIYWNRIGAIGRATVNGTGIDLNFISREPAEGFGSSANGVAADALTGPPPGPPPSNEFSFGKVKKNKRKGTAKLTVNVPGRGELDLAKTHRVKPGDETADAAGKEKLVVESRRRARKKLNADGKAKVNPKVTYAPDGGGPNTKRKKIKLVKR
jgi:hypothetical protein